MIKQELFGSQGFLTGLSLTNEELIRIRYFIRNQWLIHIKTIAPAHVNRFDELGIDHYHEASHLLDHHSIWPRKVRLFPKETFLEFRKMDFFNKLEAVFGSVEVLYDAWYGGIIWRLVRPNEKNDVGPMHADAWFMELAEATAIDESGVDRYHDTSNLPNNMDRVKIWIGIYVEPGFNGLVYVPGSHLKKYPYHGGAIDGVRKPVIDFSEDSLSPQLFEGKSGDALIFHDNLLHKGAVNKGSQTRVSIEFTILVKQQ